MKFLRSKQVWYSRFTVRQETVLWGLGALFAIYCGIAAALTTSQPIKASDNSGEYSGGAKHQTWCEIEPYCNGWRGPEPYTIMNFMAAKEQYERQQQTARAQVRPVVVAKVQHRKPVSVARVAPQPKPELPLALINFMRLSSN